MSSVMRREEPSGNRATHLSDIDITSTRPGTPGGRFMRQFWLAIHRSEDLPKGHAARMPAVPGFARREPDPRLERRDRAVQLAAVLREQRRRSPRLVRAPAGRLACGDRRAP